MVKYIYGIVKDSENRKYDILGFEKMNISSIARDGLSAIISETDSEKYSFEKKNIMIHEKTIESIMKLHKDILPARFSLIAEDEDQIKKILMNEKEEFISLFETIAGKKELGIKLLIKDAKLFLDTVINKYDAIIAERDRLKNIPPHECYYDIIALGKNIEETVEYEKTKIADMVFDKLNKISEDGIQSKTYSEKMILNAAFLVNNDKEEEFDILVDEIAREYSETLHVKYVGDLPPYNFVKWEINIHDYS